MKYKGKGTIPKFLLKMGKIRSLKTKGETILRLTHTELIMHKITTPIIFGGHFTNQSPNINGNYVT